MVDLGIRKTNGFSFAKFCAAPLELFYAILQLSLQSQISEFGWQWFDIICKRPHFPATFRASRRHDASCNISTETQEEWWSAVGEGFKCRPTSPFPILSPTELFVWFEGFVFTNSKSQAWSKSIPTELFVFWFLGCLCSPIPNEPSLIPKAWLPITKEWSDRLQMGHEKGLSATQCSWLVFWQSFCTCSHGKMRKSYERKNRKIYSNPSHWNSCHRIVGQTWYCWILKGPMIIEASFLNNRVLSFPGSKAFQCRPNSSACNGESVGWCGNFETCVYYGRHETSQGLLFWIYLHLDHVVSAHLFSMQPQTWRWTLFHCFLGEVFIFTVLLTLWTSTHVQPRPASCSWFNLQNLW